VTVAAGRARRRYLLAVAAVALVLVSLLPPVGTEARRHVFAESLQFVLFATAVPALLVLSAPWRLLTGRVSAWIGLIRVPGAGRRGGQAPRRGFGRALTVLLIFIGTVIAWRLPVAVNALARTPGLAVAELATLGAAGVALWLELVESPPLLPRISRPLRATFAAVSMWTIWAVAYVLGFSQTAWYSAYVHVAGRGLSAVADQELATWIMWAIPAFCFVPVVYVAVMTWLKDSQDPDQELQALVAERQGGPQAVRWPRPPRGWN
jgi:cytochrome c oxidase assembly factor CtaG